MYQRPFKVKLHVSPQPLGRDLVLFGHNNCRQGFTLRTKARYYLCEMSMCVCAPQPSNWSAHLETEVKTEAAPFAVGMSHCV